MRLKGKPTQPGPGAHKLPRKAALGKQQTAPSLIPAGSPTPVPPFKSPKRLDRVKLIATEKLLRECKAHSVIEEKLSQTYGVTRRTVRDWIMLVYAEWDRVAKATAPHARTRMRAAFEDFFAKAMDEDATEKGPDYKAALQALDRLARLDGVYEPERLTIETGTPFKDVDSLKARMADLLTRPDIQAALASMGHAPGGQHGSGNSGSPTSGGAGANPSPGQGGRDPGDDERESGDLLGGPQIGPEQADGSAVLQDAEPESPGRYGPVG